MTLLAFPLVPLAALVLGAAPSPRPTPAKTSGVYLTADDYKAYRLAFEGDCRSKGHKLDRHGFPNKPYVDLTHESEKRRISEGDLLGFRDCDGGDYRFAGHRACRYGM